MPPRLKVGDALGHPAGELDEAVRDRLHEIAPLAQDPDRDRQVRLRLPARERPASVGAGSSTPSYVTPYFSMKAWRTAQNAGAFMGCGVPWLAASTLP